MTPKEVNDVLGLKGESKKPTRKELLEAVEFLMDWVASGRQKAQCNPYAHEEVQYAFLLLAREQGKKYYLDAGHRPITAKAKAAIQAHLDELYPGRHQR